MEKRDVRPGFVEKAPGSAKIHVSELKIGMYVSRLDREWLETPFLMQGFLVETLDDIETICQYAEHVWVDEVRETYVPPEQRGLIRPNKRLGKPAYINKLPAQQEHAQAINVYRDARRLTRSLLQEAQMHGLVNTEQARSTVKDCVQSVLRNPDALMWMSKMRDRDEYTTEHCLNVCILAIAFGRHLGKSEKELERLGLCGLLHDVGKMRVPTEVLNKPGSLTPKEFNIVRAHTVHGRNLLMSSPNMYSGAVDVAYSHHERIDGTGYPRQLPSGGISEYARLIAIVDAYDAMTAERCYAPAIPTTEALKTIFKDRGTHFDDYYAQEFIKCVGLYPPGSLVQLVNGKVGFVLEANTRYRHLPRVIVVYDPEQPDDKRERVMDLAEIEKGELDRGYLIRRVLPDGSFGLYIKDYREKGLAFRL